MGRIVRSARLAVVGQTRSMARVDPVERVLNLLTLLHETPVPLTRSEIVDRMATGSTPYPTDEVAQHQMFSGDRRIITTALGIAIQQSVRGGSDAGRTEYWIDAGDIRLPSLELDDDERFVLTLALAAVSRSAPHVGEAAMKLSSWIGASGVGTGSPDGPYEFSVEVTDTVVALTEAARRGDVIARNWVPSGTDATSAASSSGEGGREEGFEPWAVVLSDGVWYVVGRDRSVDEAVAVRVDRVGRSDVGAPPHGVRVLEGVGRVAGPVELDEVSLGALVRASEGPSRPPTDTGDAAVGEMAEGAEVATVVVDELSAVRAMLSARVVEAGQLDLFGEVTLKVVVDDERRFRSWLLSLGDRARLEAPQHLRRSIAEWLLAIAEHEPSTTPTPRRPASPSRRRGPEPTPARLHRLLSIVPWLYRQRSVSVAEVAARVGATPQQVVRDLTLASMCGTPPYGAGELYGFWVEPETDMVHVLHPTLLTDDVRLTPRQMASVAVALASIEAMPGEHRVVAGRLREKLDRALGGMPVRVDLDDPPFLDAVATAAERNERIRIEYVDPADRITEREVDPLKVFVDRGTAYVITDDHLRGGERVFRIDRIVSVTPTGEVFRPRAIASPAGETWSWMIPEREVVVRLPAGSDWVLDRHATLAHLVEPDGSIVVWLAVVDERWLEVLLLRCGPGVEVLDPPEWSTLASRAAAAVAAHYV